MKCEVCVNCKTKRVFWAGVMGSILADAHENMPTHSPFLSACSLFLSIFLAFWHMCALQFACANMFQHAKQTADCCLKKTKFEKIWTTVDAWMISSLKKFKQICFGVSKVGDQKQKLQMLPWSMLLDKTKQTKPLPKLLTDDYFFFRCIINIIYINEVNRSNATANRKR